MVVTQETDQNHCQFKNEFQENLEFLTLARLSRNLTPSIQPYLIGLLVFGGIDPGSHETLLKNAFQEGFSKEHCLASWSKVGVAPLTRKCLQ